MDWRDAQPARRRQRQRRDVALFAALRAVPAVGVVNLPAAGSFAVVRPAGGAAGPALTLADGTTIGTPALAAGRFWLLGRLEKQSLTINGCDLYLDTGLGAFERIGGA